MEQPTRELIKDLIKELNSENLQSQEKQVEEIPDIDKELPVELISPLHHLLLQARALDYGYRNFYYSLSDYELSLFETPIGTFTDFVKQVFDAVHGDLPNESEYNLMREAIIQDKAKIDQDLKWEE